MILEGLVTTSNADGSAHLAPMGVKVELDFQKLLLRPFPTSTTCGNLLARGEGVFHVTDDALLMARAALGSIELGVEFRACEKVIGHILIGACRHYEFVVRSVDATGERVAMDAEVVARVMQREFFGFNRAKHAVIEAAILATRLHILPLAEVRAEFGKLRRIVDKTGGADEYTAMEFLAERILSPTDGVI